MTHSLQRVGGCLVGESVLARDDAVDDDVVVDVAVQVAVAPLPPRALAPIVLEDDLPKARALALLPRLGLLLELAPVGFEVGVAVERVDVGADGEDRERRRLAPLLRLHAQHPVEGRAEEALAVDHLGNDDRVVLGRERQEAAAHEVVEGLLGVQRLLVRRPRQLVAHAPVAAVLARLRVRVELAHSVEVPDRALAAEQIDDQLRLADVKGVDQATHRVLRAADELGLRVGEEKQLLASAVRKDVLNHAIHGTCLELVDLELIGCGVVAVFVLRLLHRRRHVLLDRGELALFTERLRRAGIIGCHCRAQLAVCARCVEGGPTTS